MTAEQMPPLPTAEVHEDENWRIEYFTGSQMRAYARAYAAQEVARVLQPLSDGERSALWAKMLGPNVPLVRRMRNTHVPIGAFDEIVAVVEAAIRARNA